MGALVFRKNSAEASRLIDSNSKVGGRVFFFNVIESLLKSLLMKLLYCRDGYKE